MQFHQSENFFTDDMQVNLHVRLIKIYRLNIDRNILVMDEQIKSKRLSRSIFLEERYTV